MHCNSSVLISQFAVLYDRIIKELVLFDSSRRFLLLITLVNKKKNKLLNGGPKTPRPELI